MLDSYVAIVASFFETHTHNRMFLSTDDNKYCCPRVLITNDSKKIQDYITDYIRDTTLVAHPETISSVLISAKKTEHLELDLVYSVSLPIDSKLKPNMAFLCSHNLAIIDPYVRKALQYV